MSYVFTNQKLKKAFNWFYRQNNSQIWIIKHLFFFEVRQLCVLILPVPEEENEK